jgi:hypothetical protein
MSYTLSAGEVKGSVFDPVLAAIAIAIDQSIPFIGVSNHRTYILFSGVLSECPYVFKYMEDYFENRAVILDVSDGFVCPRSRLSCGK